MSIIYYITATTENHETLDYEGTYGDAQLVYSDRDAAQAVCDRLQTDRVWGVEGNRPAAEVGISYEVQSCEADADALRIDAGEPWAEQALRLGLVTRAYYYHAGAGMLSDPDSIVWSDLTHDSRAGAEAEAIQMALAGGNPVVEAWCRDHGPYPGDADAVCDTWVVRV